MHQPLPASTRHFLARWASIRAGQPNAVSASRGPAPRGPGKSEPPRSRATGPTDDLRHRLLRPTRTYSRPRDVVLIGGGARASRLYFPALLALQERNALIVRAVIDSPAEGNDAARAAFPDALHVPSFAMLPPWPAALALIASPASQHPAQANAALKRGWHVLCSSPLAPHATEAALMIAAAQRHERLLAIDLRSRFFPALVFLRTLCQDNLLGPALGFQLHLGEARPLSSTSPPAEKFSHPDGALTALGGPGLELLTWCFGAAGIVKYADDAMGGVEANAVIDLSFREGLRGTIHLSRDWPIADSHTFVFERGILRWSGNRVNALTLQLASAPSALAAELVLPLAAVHSPSAAPLTATEDQAGLAQLENVIAAIAGREVLLTPATEAMRSLPLIDACYAQRLSLAQPWLSRNDAVHARALAPPVTLRRP